MKHFTLYLPQLANRKFQTSSSCVFPRHSVGDTKVPFCLQSCVKPLKYAIAVNDLGTEYVHRYVGKEPSGLRFNKLFLNEDGKRYIILNNANTQFQKIIKQATQFDFESFHFAVSS